MKLKIGDWVKVKSTTKKPIVPKDKTWHKVSFVAFFADDDHGVYVAEDLWGKRYWNENDLTKTKPRKSLLTTHYKRI